MESQSDPYLLSTSKIKAPPTTFLGKLKFLGPGFILSASIVGSGELIATTTLGAQAGFITFWVIIVSCLVKVAVQVEFGKHTILTGETAMTAFNQLPGPKFGKANWTVWSFFILLATKILQVGGVLGGVAITLNIFLPGVDITVWAFLIAIAVALLIFQGYYKFIEGFSLVMIGLFTIMTFVSLYFLKYTEFAISWADIQSGLTLSLPATAVGVAIGAFGITGVGGDEIIAYNYWCLEKGYASYTGPKSADPEWEKRARGWIEVMKLDAVVAMVFYTLVTAAFYILGAAVLHSQGEVPAGFAMIETLSGLYTETLGEGARTVFMLGAFIVLFSTLFAALAAWTRAFTDVFGTIGWIDFKDIKQRRKSIAYLAWIIPFLWAGIFVFIKMPVQMVIIGGIITSIILFIVIFATYQFRYKRLDSKFKPRVVYDVALWVSIIVIILVGLYGIIKLF